MADVRVALDSPKALALVQSSDTSGLVVFSEVPPGSWKLCCLAAGTRMTLDLEPGKIQTVQVTVPTGEGMVQVFDEIGTPIADAEVRATRLMFPKDVGMALGTTDRHGELRVVGIGSPIYVEASAKGHTDSFRKMLSAKENGVELILPGGGSTVRGSVIESNSWEPMAGVLIEVGKSNPGAGRASNGVFEPAPSPRRTVTGANGTFLLEGLALGHLQITASRAGWGTHRKWVQVHPELNHGVTAVTFEMAPGFRIQGRVLQASGNPAADLLVYATDGNRVRTLTETSESGSFEFHDLLNPPVTLQVKDYEMGQQAWAVVTEKEASGVEMVLSPRHSIAGRITDALGQPVERAKLGVWRGVPGEQGSLVTVFRSLANGTFHILLDPSIEQAIPIAVYPQAQAVFPSLVLQAEPGSQDVLVQLSDGASEPGALVMRSKTTLRIEQLADPQSVHYAPPQGPESEIRVSPIPAGTYRICTGNPADSWVEWKTVTLGPGETLDLGTAPVDEDR